MIIKDDIARRQLELFRDAAQKGGSLGTSRAATAFHAYSEGSPEYPLWPSKPSLGPSVWSASSSSLQSCSPYGLNIHACATMRGILPSRKPVWQVGSSTRHRPVSHSLAETCHAAEFWDHAT